MSDSIQSENASYESQIETEIAKKHKVPNVIGQPHKIDAWRHDRMYDFLSPIYKNYADKKWLTVGDSGADAFSLRKRGVQNIVSSSLSDSRLQELKDSGPLADIKIKALNAENTDEPDNSYDVVVCKEAFHHFPRPAIGFYELLRISSSVVAYIEPNCDNRFYILRELRTLVKKCVRGDSRSEQEFEPAGNFIFMMSVLEVEKMASALQLPVVAHKVFNDFFVYSLADSPKTDKLAWNLHKLGVFTQWLLSKLKLLDWGRVVVLVFKEMPSEEVLRELKTAGYSIKHTPRNPYIEPAKPIAT